MFTDLIKRLKDISLGGTLAKVWLVGDSQYRLVPLPLLFLLYVILHILTTLV